MIRKGNVQDFAEIFLLIKEFALFQNTPEKLTITVEQMTKEKNLFHCFVAENDKKQIVGFASFFFAYYSWTGKAIYLDDLYVKEDYRNQGIGKKLLEAVINLAQTEKCRKLRWQVSKWNMNAIQFYKKMGATIDTVEINCDLLIASNDKS